MADIPCCELRIEWTKQTEATRGASTNDAGKSAATPLHHRFTRLSDCRGNICRAKETPDDPPGSRNCLVAGDPARAGRRFRPDLSAVEHKRNGRDSARPREHCRD